MAAYVQILDASNDYPPSSPAGDVSFEERMQHTGEFDGEALFEMPHDAAGRLANRHGSADLGPALGRNGSAGFRDIDHAHRHICAVGQNEARHRVAWHDAAVAAILGHA